MSAFLTIYAIFSTLFGFSVVQSYDYTVCLTAIQLDSYWYSSIWGVHPYAIVYVDGVKQFTTDDSTDSLTVYYSSTAHCVELNEGSVYKVTLYESEYTSDDYVCWSSDTISDYDVGTNTNSCTDSSSGNSNYMSFTVEENTVEPTITSLIITRSYIEYTAGSSGLYIGSSETLDSCKSRCESDSSCNYLTYGYFNGNSVPGCSLFTYYSSEVRNSNAVSVSYACAVYHQDNLGSGVCSDTSYNNAACGWDFGDCCMATNADLTSNDYCYDPLNQDTTTTTTSYPVPYGCYVANPDNLGSGYCTNSAPYNTAACEWDGGDCCMATNPSLSNDDDCLDPRYTTTTTTTTSTTTSTTASSGDLTACEWILDNLSNEPFPFSQIGDGSCDATTSSNHNYYYSYNLVSASTTINDETCNWEGGDCCMETNPSLSTNDDCLNPLYATTSTTTTSTTTGGSGYNPGSSAYAPFIAVPVVLVMTVSSFILS